MKGFWAYVIGWLLISAGATGTGTVVIAVGMLIDWKWWLLGLVAFLWGVNSG
jgi:hypothetical protein